VVTQFQSLRSQLFARNVCQSAVTQFGSPHEALTTTTCPLFLAIVSAAAYHCDLHFQLALYLLIVSAPFTYSHEWITRQLAVECGTQRADFGM
jgi:hypothetical protein